MKHAWFCDASVFEVVSLLFHLHVNVFKGHFKKRNREKCNVHETEDQLAEGKSFHQFCVFSIAPVPKRARIRDLKTIFRTIIFADLPAIICGFIVAAELPERTVNPKQSETNDCNMDGAYCPIAKHSNDPRVEPETTDGEKNENQQMNQHYDGVHFPDYGPPRAQFHAVNIAVAPGEHLFISLLSGILILLTGFKVWSLTAVVHFSVTTGPYAGPVLIERSCISGSPCVNRADKGGKYSTANE